MHNTKKIVQHIFSANPITAPIMRLAAYLKNDIFGEKVEDIISSKMRPGWKDMKILDLGSGPCRKERDRRFHNVDITCFDIFEPYLAECQRYGFPIVLGDVQNVHTYFPKKSFDIIWLIDVIEHLPKKKGLTLLFHLDKIARKQVIISTPLGWYPQDYECIEAEWLSGTKRTTEKNIHQQHISSWLPVDFQRRGYSCQTLYNYHYDIRSGSKELRNKKKPVSASQLWAVKNID